MRSGYLKESFSELTALTDSNVVRFWVLLLIGSLILAPLVFGAYGLSHLTVILITLVGVMGLTILTGFTGLISLGHVGFLLLGAYTYAIGITRYDLPPLLAIGLSCITPAIAGLIVGIPSLRLKGLYLAITTLAFTFIMNSIILAGGEFTGASRGIMVDRPEILGISLQSDQALYWFCLFVAVLSVLACLNIRRTKLGRALMAIRDNDIAAQSMGINLWRYKLTAFVLSALLTGLAGALMAIYINFVTVEGFPFLFSIEALAIIIVGGMGSVLGAVLGTVFIVLLPEFTTVLFSMLGGRITEIATSGANEIKGVLYGLAIVGFLRLDPRGIRGVWLDIKHTWVHWPLRY